MNLCSTLLRSVCGTLVLLAGVACGGKAEDSADAKGDVTCQMGNETYEVGDVIENGCNSCSCSEDGTIACTQRACAARCEFNGNSYAVGEEFWDSQGCNWCSCGADGTVGCTDRACAPNCEVDGVFYSEGENVPSERCTQCTCTAGEVECLATPCLPEECEVDGIYYYEGEPVPSSDCNACVCSGGEIACDDAVCPPVDPCDLPFDAGECEGAFPVYAFNALTGMCENEIYGGCGGNDNRFDSESSCLEACGATLAP